MKNNEYRDLIGLMSDYEAIYRIDCMYPGIWPTYIIGPADCQREADGKAEVDDLSGCIEDTLHRLLEAGFDPADAMSAVIADDEDLEENEYGEFPEGIYYIDLDYIIRDFYPVSVSWVMDAEKSEDAEEEIAEEAEVA